MKIKTILAAATSIAALSMTSAMANTITIDDFETAVEVTDPIAPGATASAAQMGPSIFLGAQRTVSINAAAVGPTAGTPGATVAIENGIAQFSSNANVQFVATLVYLNAMPQNIDLAGPNDRFQIDVQSGDGIGEFVFGVEDDMGRSATVTRIVDAELLGVTEFLFADFVGDVVDLTKIVGIAFQVNGTPDLDLTIEFLGITDSPIPEVPLPAGAPLILSALAGFAAFRKLRIA